MVYNNKHIFFFKYGMYVCVVTIIAFTLQTMHNKQKLKILLFFLYVCKKGSTYVFHAANFFAFPVYTSVIFFNVVGRFCFLLFLYFLFFVFVFVGAKETYTNTLKYTQTTAIFISRCSTVVYLNKLFLMTRCEH
jgi:hypothetical protein